MGIFKKLFQKSPADEAMREARKLIKEKPDDVSTWMKLASAYTLAGKNKAALEVYDVLLKEYPEDHAIWLSIAMVYLDENQTEDAIAAAKNALSTKDSRVGHELLGRAYFQDQQWENSISEFTKFSDDEDTGPEIWYFLWEAYKKIGNREASQSANKKALVAYEKASEINPNDLNLWLRLASLYLDIYEKRKAISAMEQAARLDSKYREVVEDMRRNLL